MNKSFKDLQIGHKVFLNLWSYYIIRLEYKNGYLAIQINHEFSLNVKPWGSHWLYIPMNHIHSNKLKVTKHGMLNITVTGYLKYVKEFVQRQLEK